MFDDAKKIRDLPAGVRKSIYFTIAAWLGHWAFFFVYFQNSPGEFPLTLFYRHLGMGVVICVFLVLQRPWAKWLGAMGNLMAVLYYIMWIAMAYKHRFLEAMVMVAIILLFIASTYYLFCKESAEFFKVRRDDSNPALDEITSDKDSRKK